MSRMRLQKLNLTGNTTSFQPMSEVYDCMTKALEQLTESEYEIKLAISVLLQRQIRENRISKISVLREATTMLQEVTRKLESVRSTE